MKEGTEREEEDFLGGLLKMPRIESPVKQISEILSNLQIMSEENEAIRQVVGNLDPFMRSRKRKIMYYIRVYSSLLHADSYFQARNLARTRQHLEIAFSTKLTVKIREEAQYVKKIRGLVKFVLDALQKERLSQHESDRLRTRIHIAQNVCVLRILSV